MANKRIDRISEEVMKAIAQAIRSIKDPRVKDALVSITRCDVTGDLRFAKVYVSVLGAQEQAKGVMQGLKSAAGFLRHEVGQRVQLRYTPELLFTLDDSIENGVHISKVINDLEKAGKMGDRTAPVEEIDDE